MAKGPQLYNSESFRRIAGVIGRPIPAAAQKQINNAAEVYMERTLVPIPEDISLAQLRQRLHRIQKATEKLSELLSWKGPSRAAATGWVVARMMDRRASRRHRQGPLDTLFPPSEKPGSNPQEKELDFQGLKKIEALRGLAQAAGQGARHALAELRKHAGKYQTRKHGIERSPKSALLLSLVQIYYSILGGYTGSKAEAKMLREFIAAGVAPLASMASTRGHFRRLNELKKISSQDLKEAKRDFKAAARRDIHANGGS